MATVRLGVIGFGRRLRSMLATLRTLEPDARVVALLDPRADALAAEFPSDLAAATACRDAEQLLGHHGVDGVMVGTRCTLHAPYALEVLRSGLPLFLEKPVATSWEQLRQLEAASRSTRSRVVVSFPLRVSAMCDLARRIVDSGAIGTVEQIQAVNNVPGYAAGYYHGWMRDEAETGGLWLQKATHDFDYLNYLAGQRPVRICAMESKTVFRGDMPVGLHCVDCDRVDCPEKPDAPPSWLCAFGVDTGNHDSASAIVQYASGMHLVYSQNFYTRRGAAARGATLIGYRGSLRFDWYQDELTVYQHHTGRVERHRFEAGPEETGHHGGDTELARDFLKIVAGEGVSRTPLEVALTSVEMCLAARDSCRQGRFVDVGAPAEVTT